jgi:hypothetical protein
MVLKFRSGNNFLYKHYAHEVRRAFTVETVVTLRVHISTMFVLVSVPLLAQCKVNEFKSAHISESGIHTAQ